MFSYILLPFSALLLTVVTAQSPCTTPLGEPAQCVPVRQCTMILDVLRTRNATLIAIAKSFNCQGADGKPNVCCGTQLEGTWTPNKSSVPYVDVANRFLPAKTDCGMQSSERIVGGEKTALLEFPWMALLGYTDENGQSAGWRCGGTLISKRYVLTAAHCLRGRFQQDFNFSTVRLGEHTISTPSDCYLLHDYNECFAPEDLQAQPIPHPQYNSRSGDNDIALLRLEKDVTFKDNIRPICLPNSEVKQSPPGTMMYACGWGATENGSASDVKLKVKVPLVELTKCADRFKRTRTTVSQNQVCAGGEANKDSCKGDSGGPLMHTYTSSAPNSLPQYYQEGVVSRGIGCGTETYPGIYTRVSRYLQWIADTMRD